MNQDLTRPLRAFWVGDYDIFAAFDEAQALRLGNVWAMDPETFAEDEVEEVSAETLGEPVAKDFPDVTLRGLLYAMKEPGHMAGYER
jgi:hypothetical protein